MIKVKKPSSQAKKAHKQPKVKVGIKMGGGGAPAAQSNTIAFKPPKEAKHCEYVDLYLGQVKPTTTTAEVIMSRLLYPACVQPSVWAVMASIYSQYRVKSVEIEYRPDVGTTTDGSLFIWFDPDAESDDPNIDVIPEVAKAHIAKQTAVWNRCSVTQQIPGNWLGTTPTGDPRTYACGIVRVATNSSLTIAKVYGSLYVRARVEFRNRTLNPNMSVSAPAMTNFSANNTAVTGATTYPLSLWYTDGTDEATNQEVTLGIIPGDGATGILLKAGQWLLRNILVTIAPGTTETVEFWNSIGVSFFNLAGALSTLVTSYLYDYVASPGVTASPVSVNDCQLYLECKEDVLVKWDAMWGSSGATPTVRQAVEVVPVSLSAIDAIALSMAKSGDMRGYMVRPGQWVRRIRPKTSTIRGQSTTASGESTTSSPSDFHEIAVRREQPLRELRSVCRAEKVGSGSTFIDHSAACAELYALRGIRQCEM
jgi:hypothetical protein